MVGADSIGSGALLVDEMPTLTNSRSPVHKAHTDFRSQRVKGEPLRVAPAW